MIDIKTMIVNPAFIVGGFAGLIVGLVIIPKLRRD